LRGSGQAPGLMYSRGTAVDAPYTYDPSLGATRISPVTGKRTNTMRPDSRVTNQTDIDYLHLEKVVFRSMPGKNNDAIQKGELGTLTNKFH
jgi:hypothetical protein